MTETSPRTCVILGAASAVAIAFARQACAAGPVRLVLAGRDGQRLAGVLADMNARGASANSFVVTGDLGEPAAVPGLAAEILARAGRVDDVLLAYGILGEQAKQQADPAAARQLLDVNFVSAALWCEVFAAHFEKAGRGRLAVIGSVAGDRGRQSNYLYGASKGGLERVCEGLAHRFAASPDISISLIKPGFIDTPMTDQFPKGGPLWATPETVADVIQSAMDKRRVRVYAPWFWRWIMVIIRALPVFVIHRTKL